MPGYCRRIDHIDTGRAYHTVSSPITVVISSIAFRSRGNAPEISSKLIKNKKETYKAMDVHEDLTAFTIQHVSGFCLKYAKLLVIYGIK